TEPTDRSNSPEVISNVIPKVIMPSSGVKASKLLMLPGDRNAGVRTVKTTISHASRTNGPNSGAEISLWSNAVNRIWEAEDRDWGRRNTNTKAGSSHGAARTDRSGFACYFFEPCMSFR